MHALIENNVVTALRNAPSGGAWEDGEWLDFTDPTVLSEWEARHGYTLVVETPQPQDTDTVKHDESVVLVDGVPTQKWTARPWNAAEVAERAAAANAVTLQADTAAYLTKLKEAIDALAVLLADDTTAGSIRQVMGPAGAAAGTGSLRALKAQTNTAVVTAASVKALIDLNITLAQRSIDDARAGRRVARQTLRLARAMVGDYTSTDVGAP